MSKKTLHIPFRVEVTGNRFSQNQFYRKKKIANIILNLINLFFSDFLDTKRIYVINQLKIENVCKPVSRIELLEENVT